jgi:DNA-directed RNA polymerase subunit F
MDDFTLYLDLMQQSCVQEEEVIDKQNIQIPEIRDVLNMINKKKINLEPSESAVRKILDFANQFEVVETEDEQWELNLN